MISQMDSIYLALIIFGAILIIVSLFLKSKKIKYKNDIKKNKNNQQELANIYNNTNEKMKALNEYSEFILDEVEKRHKELLFMYQLISEKEKSLNSNAVNSNIINDTYKKTKTKSKIFKEQKEYKDKNNQKGKNTVDLSEKDNSVEIKNKEIKDYHKQILDLYNNGLAIKEIAKKLDIGIGEVKLVIDLFNEVANE